MTAPDVTPQMVERNPHYFECPYCGERLAVGANRCHRCWKAVAV